MPKSRQKQNESRNHKTTEQRGAAVNISYNKLWKLLIDRNMMKKDLIQLAGISTNAMAKMGKGGDVSTQVLRKICSIAISAILSAFAGMMQRGVCRKIRQNK